MWQAITPAQEVISSIAHGRSDVINLRGSDRGCYRHLVRLHYIADHETGRYRHVISGAAILEIDSLVNDNDNQRFLLTEIKNSGVCYEYDGAKTIYLGKTDLLLGLMEIAGKLYLEIYNDISSHTDIVPTGARIP